MLKDNDTLFCFRCYHTWKRRRKNPPKTCPKCNSPYWSKPRKKALKEFVEKMQELIINIHNAIIKLGGGEVGIREDGGIYNSTLKLLNNQNKNRTNPTGIGAFALNEFAKRHYFVDGNKRTAYAIAKVFMLLHKCHLRTNYLEATQFMKEIAEYNSQVTYEDIKKWLDINCNPIEEKDIETYLNKVFVDLTEKKIEGVEDGNKNN